MSKRKAGATAALGRSPGGDLACGLPSLRVDHCVARHDALLFVMSTEVETSLAILLFARSSLTSFRGPVGAATAPRTRR